MGPLPFDPEGLRSPDALAYAYDALRGEGRVHRTTAGFWVDRFSDCRTVLESRDYSSSVAALSRIRRESSNLLFTDGRRHEALRRTVRSIVPLADDEFRGFAFERSDEVATSLKERSEIDVARDFAQPIAAAVAAKVLGTSSRFIPDLAGRLMRLGPIMDPFSDEQTRRRAEREALDLVRWFAHVMPSPSAESETLESEPMQSLVSKDRSLFYTTALVLAHAAFENTANFLTSAILMLLNDRDARESVIEAAVGAELIDELLRLCSPAHTLVRRAERHLPMFGSTVRPGELVFVLLGAANRDPDRFPEPSLIKATRASHVAFGHGRHSCPGAALAKSEAGTALEHFFRTFPRSHPISEVWGTSVTMRGLTSLVVTTGR